MVSSLFKVLIRNGYLNNIYFILNTTSELLLNLILIVKIFEYNQLNKLFDLNMSEIDDIKIMDYNKICEATFYIILSHLLISLVFSIIFIFFEIISLFKLKNDSKQK